MVGVADVLEGEVAARLDLLDLGDVTLRSSIKAGMPEPEPQSDLTELPTGQYL